jgi:uncharacterized protein (DUF1800 family)
MPLRRSLLVSAAIVAACSPAGRAGTPPAPLSARGASWAPRELTADEQIRQALNRLTFGERPGDFERVRAMGVDRWIAQQLEPDRIDDRATERLLERFPTLAMSPAELVQAYPPPALQRLALRRAQRAGAGAAGAGDGGARDSAGANSAQAALSQRKGNDSVALRQARQATLRPIAELEIAKVVRAESSERQLLEVMVDFWENHFNVFVGKGPERYYLSAYERDVIRPHALGRFRDLLEAVAKSPAMLFYLDNWESAVEPGRPALAMRRGAAAVPGGLLALRRRSRLGARGIGEPVRPVRADSTTPRRRPQGLNENYGRELLELHTLGVDGGYTQQDVVNAARAFTGWSIARPRQGGGFVFRPELHDAGEKIFLGHRLPAGRGIEDGEEVLDIVAKHPSTARFIATKLVRRFVSDSPPPALVDRAAATFQRTDGDIREVLRTIFASPEFFSRSAYKAKVKTPLELVVSARRAVGAEPDLTPRTARLIAQLGEPLFGHRDPNGYPETADPWINTGTILNRINFGLALAAGRLPGVSLPRWAHAEGLDTLSGEAQVDGVIHALLGGEASPDTRRVLVSGVNPLVERPSERLDGLARTVGLAIGAPEFQRR